MKALTWTLRRRDSSTSISCHLRRDWASLRSLNCPWVKSSGGKSNSSLSSVSMTRSHVPYAMKTWGFKSRRSSVALTYSIRNAWRASSAFRRARARTRPVPSAERRTTTRRLMLRGWNATCYPVSYRCNHWLEVFWLATTSTKVLKIKAISRRTRASESALLATNWVALERNI